MADATESSEPESKASEAPTDLAVWKAALPERQSACASDGQQPWLAIPVMLIGVVVAAAGGIVAAAIAVAFLAVFVDCLQLTPEPINIVKVVLLLGSVGNVIIFIALAILCLFAICLAVMGILPYFVRLGRNRSEGIVFVYGLVAAGLAAILFKSAIVLAFEPDAPTIREIGIFHAVRWAWGVTTADVILTTIWALLTMLIGATMAWAAALDGRWCAGCNYRAMRRRREIGLNYGRLRNFVSACDAKEPQRAATIASDRPSGKVGQDGRATLYECRGCGRGVLEATATYEHADYRRTWLAASLPLSPHERAEIDPILARGPAPRPTKRGNRRSTRKSATEAGSSKKV